MDRYRLRLNRKRYINVSCVCKHIYFILYKQRVFVTSFYLQTNFSLLSFMRWCWRVWVAYDVGSCFEWNTGVCVAWDVGMRAAWDFGVCVACAVDVCPATGEIHISSHRIFLLLFHGFSQFVYASSGLTLNWILDISCASDLHCQKLVIGNADDE